MQAAFDAFAGMQPHDDVDTDINELFYLLNTTADADEQGAGALDCQIAKHHEALSLGGGGEAFCLMDLLPSPSGFASLKIKQEPIEACRPDHPVVDPQESSLACTSSSGCVSSFTDTPVSAQSPIHRASTPLFGLGPQDVLPVTHNAPPFTQLPCSDSAQTQAFTAAASFPDVLGRCAIDADALATDEASAPTQSDSTDAALYDFPHCSKAATSRSAGRGSSSIKKPPLSHSTIEKHRRDRINHLIEELGEMVPAVDPRYRGDGADASGLKRPKHAVLADVVVRYRQLQVENESMRRQLATARMQQPASVSTLGNASGPGLNLGPSAASGSAVSAGQPPRAQSERLLTLPIAPAQPQVVRASATPASVGVVASAGNQVVHSPVPSASSLPTSGLLEGSAAAPAAIVTQSAGAAAPTASPPAVPASAAPYVSTSCAPSASAAAAAAVSSLLTQAAAAAGASAAQLQTALPLIKAAAAAAVAAAAPSPLSGFVPVVSPGAHVASAAAATALSSFSGGLCHRPTAAPPTAAPHAAAAASTSNNYHMKMPSFSPMTILLPNAGSAPVADTWAPPTDAATAAASSPDCAPMGCGGGDGGGGGACVPVANTFITTATPTTIGAPDIQASAPAAELYGGNSPVLPDLATAAIDGADSCTTEVHVCRGNAATRTKPSADATRTKPITDATTAAAAVSGLSTDVPLYRQCSNSSDMAVQEPLRRMASDFAPESPPAAAAASSAASSWLVRVVCPPCRDLLGAACAALEEAGVVLRAARVSAAPGGRMALELEVSCEEGVLPRGMQAGHIQCAIHSALQASAPAEGAAGVGGFAPWGCELGDPERGGGMDEKQAARRLTHGRLMEQMRVEAHQEDRGEGGPNRGRGSVADGESLNRPRGGKKRQRL